MTIVKKHTILGCEMIDEIASDIDERIIKHAKDIAKYHHERIDGTGYPEGLKGEDIPISARVVSIADSFDALTSSRSYKAAFSQDVAIEMISNGMSGVFDDVLVECLLNVVNYNELVAIRETLSKNMRVVVDPNTLSTKRILIAGNTGYVNEKFIEDSFENNHVLIVGDTHLKSKGKVKVYNGKRLPYKEIFETYDFDVIIFFARELTYRTKDESDAEKFRELLSLTAKYQKDAKVIHYITDEAGDNIIRAFGKMKYFIKSKTVRKEVVEMAVEVYCKNNDTFFLEKVRDIEGVNDVTLIQYNGEYHG